MAKLKIENDEELAKQDCHAFKDHTGRFAVDALLRYYGYRIKSRPRAGEAVWEGRGETVPHSQAVLGMHRGELKRAEDAERDYRRRK